MQGKDDRLYRGRIEAQFSSLIDKKAKERARSRGRNRGRSVLLILSVAPSLDMSCSAFAAATVRLAVPDGLYRH